MNIRSAVKKDYRRIAELHSSSITTGFLSTLGSDFLSELYKAIHTQNTACLLVAETENSVCGFIAGTVNTKGLYKNVLLKNWYHFIIPFARFVFNVKVILRSFETLRYGFRKDKKNASNMYSAELLSVAVDSNVRGTGIGKELVESLEAFFKEKNITQYKVVTFSKDQNANKFYISCKFKLNCQFIHHGNLLSQYVKEI